MWYIDGRICGETVMIRKTNATALQMDDLYKLATHTDQDGRELSREVHALNLQPYLLHSFQRGSEEIKTTAPVKISARELLNETIRQFVSLVETTRLGETVLYVGNWSHEYCGSRFLICKKNAFFRGWWRVGSRRIALFLNLW